MARLRMLAALALGWAAQPAFSAPTVCSYGYGDSTCVPALSAPAQTPTTCSTQPGWTTTAAAVWQGYRYSAPQCLYQAPQTCPANTTQLTAATWNGSSWDGPTCQPIAATPPTNGAYLVVGNVWCARTGTAIWPVSSHSPVTWYWEWSYQMVAVPDPTYGLLYYAVPWQGPIPPGGVNFSGGPAFPSNWQTMSIPALEAAVGSAQLFPIADWTAGGANNGIAMWDGQTTCDDN